MTVETGNPGSNSFPPRISIIIPCFQQGVYLPRAIDSVISQSFSDWELIIINDGSTDNTREIAENHSKKYQKFRIKLIHQSNMGASGARNSGIKVASSSWVFPLDADDELLPDALERLITAIDAFPDCDIIYPDFYFTGAREGKYVACDENRLQEELLFDSITPSSLYKKSLWEKIGGYDVNLRTFEDWDFWLSAIQAGAKFYHLPIPIYKYFIHDSVQGVNYRTSDKFTLAFSQLLIKHSKLFPDFIVDLGKTRLTGYIFSVDAYIYSRRLMVYPQNYRTALVDLCRVSIQAASPNQVIEVWDKKILEYVELFFQEVKSNIYTHNLKEYFQVDNNIPVDPTILWLSAKKTYLQGNNNQARSLWVKCTALYPNFLPAYFDLIRMYIEMENWREASIYLDKIQKLQEWSNEIAKFLVILQCYQGEYQEFMPKLIQLLNQQPSDIDLLLCLASLVLSAGEKEKAKAILVKILNIEPNSHQALTLYTSIR